MGSIRSICSLIPKMSFKLCPRVILVLLIHGKFWQGVGKMASFMFAREVVSPLWS